MIGRRSIVGLALISALALCAFAAQGASAAGTTQVTCTNTGTQIPGTEKYSDAHCKTANPSGSFYHVAIGTSATDVTVTNSKTNAGTTAAEPAVLETILGGVAAKITCTTVHGTGTATNIVGPPMKVTGTVTVNYTGCTVNEPLNCTVTEPIVVTSKTETKEEGAKMWVEFTIDPPKTNFVEITFGGGAPCSLNGQTIIVKGHANATPEGATLTFATGAGELTVGNKEAKFTSKGTVVMKNPDGTTGNPIALTTE